MQRMKKFENPKMKKHHKQQKSILMEIQEMKTTINELKKNTSTGTSTAAAADHTVGALDDVHEHVVSLNKKANEIQEMGQSLVSKQVQASHELNIALKKLTLISMKNSQMGTTLEQNLASENGIRLAEDKKIDVENLKKRVLELENQLVSEKKVMGDEIVVLRERLSGMRTIGFVENGNLELKKETDELKARNKELVERIEAMNKTTRHKKTTMNARKLECERVKLKDALTHLSIVRDENLVQKKEIDELKRKVEQNEAVVVEKDVAMDRTVKENEELRRQMDELEKQLDGKRELELENEKLKESLSSSMQSKCAVGDGGSKEKSDQLKKVIEELSRKLHGKTAPLGAQEADRNSSVLNEQSVNFELQEARKELINGLRGMSSSLAIGVKMMGELDLKPFLHASNNHNSSSEKALSDAIQLCCSWRENIKNPIWHPFKLIIKNDDVIQEVIDEEDAKLKRLKDESGEEVYNAVITAIMEMKQYNPGSDTKEPVQELWNYKEGNRATLKEGISFMSRLLKLYMRRV